MNRTERLEAALRHEETDRPPFSFWYPFGLQHMDAVKTAEAYISFWNEFKPDFLKIGCNYPFPPTENINLNSSLENLRQEFTQGTVSSCWNRNLSVLGTISEYNKSLAANEKFWTVYTVLSPWTILCKICNEDEIFKTLTLNHEDVKEALDIISQALITHIKYAIDAGIQGIYFVMTEADYAVLNPLQHEVLCKDINQTVLESAQSLPFNILNIRGSRTYFTTMTDYKVKCVSWNHFRTKLGLAKGQKEWGKNYCIIGGINHEVLHSMPSNAIKKFFDRHSDEFSMPGLIVAPPAPLSGDISIKTLQAVKFGLESISRKVSALSDRRHTIDGGYIKAELRNSEPSNSFEKVFSADSQDDTETKGFSPDITEETDKIEENPAFLAEQKQAEKVLEVDSTLDTEPITMPRDSWRTEHKDNANRYDLNNRDNRYYSDDMQGDHGKDRYGRAKGRNDRSERRKNRDDRSRKSSPSYHRDHPHRNDRPDDRRERPYRDSKSGNRTERLNRDNKDPRTNRPYRDDRVPNRADHLYRNDRPDDRRERPYRDGKSDDRRNRQFSDNRPGGRRERPYRDNRRGTRSDRPFEGGKRNDRPDNRLRTGKRIRISPNR